MRTSRLPGPARVCLCLSFLLATSLVKAQTLDLSPTEIVFTTEVGAPPPAAQSFQVISSPLGQPFTAQVEVGLIGNSFLSLVPTNGITPAQVTVFADTSGFTMAGSRSANVQVRLQNTNELKVVKVTVQVSDPGSTPRISVSPPAFNFAALNSDVMPAPQQLQVANPGAGILDYQMAIDYPQGAPTNWLALAPLTGSVTFEQMTHQVQVADLTGLTEGTFTAQITVNGNATNTPVVIPVSLRVGADPAISATPPSLAFFASAGGAFPELQSIEIRNAGQGSLRYDIDSDQPWLFVRPFSGDASIDPVVHEVVPDIRGLPQGTFLANLIITSADLDTPFLIPIRLTIGPPSRVFALPSRLDFIGNANIPVVEKRAISLVNTPASPGRWSARVVQPQATWLKVSPDQGRLPSHLIVEVDTTGLGASTLAADIEIISRQGGGAAPLAEEGAKEQAESQTIVPVQLTVLSNPPTLGSAPGSILFQGVEGSPDVLQQIIQVNNDGGPQLNWEASVETDNGLDWLTLRENRGRAPSLTVASANTTSLGLGVHHGRIILSAGPQKRIIPVALALARGQGALDSDRTAVYWELAQGSAAIAPQPLRILNRGSSPLGWTAQTTGFTGSEIWLSGAPRSGIAEARSNEDPVQVQLTPATVGLVPGEYGSLVQLRSNVDNSPRIVSAMLRMLGPQDSPIPTMRPGGLSFRANGVAPAQTVRFWRNREGAMAFQAGATEFDGEDWLRVLPATGSTDLLGVAELDVDIDASGLAPGTYRGLVSLTLGGGAVDSALVTLVVPVGSACSAQSVSVAPILPQMGFRAVDGRGLPLEVELIDSCGRLVNDAAVLAGFNTGDEVISLKRVAAGRFAATWAPQNAISQANVRFIAIAGAFRDETSVIGAVEGGANPTISRGGLVNGASFARGEGIAPGAIVSVFGRNLGARTEEADLIPLPTQLGETRLLVAGDESPLYFGGIGQINAQALTDLPPGVVAQAVARVGIQYSAPEEFAVASARPGLFFIPSASGANRAIVQNQDGSLNSPSNPARPGEAIVIYISGIGAVNPAVMSGDAAPAAEPFSRSALDATVTVGGVEGQILFLGMTPNFVGLAQGNILLDAATPVGDNQVIELVIDSQPSLPLVLSVGAPL